MGGVKSHTHVHFICNCGFTLKCDSYHITLRHDKNTPFRAFNRYNIFYANISRDILLHSYYFQLSCPHLSFSSTADMIQSLYCIERDQKTILHIFKAHYLPPDPLSSKSFHTECTVHHSTAEFRDAPISCSCTCSQTHFNVVLTPEGDTI